jgi:hypothetical protein
MQRTRMITLPDFTETHGIFNVAVFEEKVIEKGR